MNLVRIFHPNRRRRPEIVGGSGSGGGEMDLSGKPRKQKQQRNRRPRLERRNAIKNIDYEAGDAESDESTRGGLRTRSLDLPPTVSLSSYSDQTSFRIRGSFDGEMDVICRNLGLSGPEDFAIPAADWEARKARSSSDILPRSRLVQLESYRPLASRVEDELMPDWEEERQQQPWQQEEEERQQQPWQQEEERQRQPWQQEEEDHRDALPDRFRDEVRVSAYEPKPSNSSQFSIPAGSGNGGGIRGARPPILAPPPSMSLPALDKIGGSTWDILKSLAPEDDNNNGGTVHTRSGISSDSEDSKESEGEDEDEDEEVAVEEDRGVRLGVTAADLAGSSSLWTSNDEDSSSTTTTTTEGMYVISPNGRFKRNIGSWMRGRLLGSGSFGTVYEGISNDGFFFAIKEVSLLDQGSNAQQCIDQLEQEIALLSQFEHENIVQYLGTDKGEAKIYIFLELVTQGSLASLYQKYRLRDSQVSAYTRQILNGLRYLHERNVVHRDIKCANILVDASGSVKLADFGLAKETTKLSMLKSCKGSVYWMAPEVVNPRRTYGNPADIWSLGCAVLEMLTQQVPFPDLEWTQALFKIGRGEPPPIPNSLSRDARDFIQQCVQVDPDDRPSASKLLDHPFVKRPLSTHSSSDSSTHNNDRRN